MAVGVFQGQQIITMTTAADAYGVNVTVPPGNSSSPVVNAGAYTGGTVNNLVFLPNNPVSPVHNWLFVGSIIFNNGTTAGLFTVTDGYGNAIGQSVYVAASTNLQVYYNRAFYGLKLSALPAGASGITVILSKKLVSGAT
jgi:hypothetical protein